jgi:apolipoprotein N-acyltransferase
MASKRDGFVLPAWLAATALSAVFWWFGSGVDPLWWMTWLSPLPVLWLAPRVRARWAALAAFVAYAAGGLNVFAYLHTSIGLPLSATLPAIAQPGLVLALCVVVFRRLLMRGHALAAALAVPATWVAAEYVNNLLSPHATFFNIGYTQMDALAVVQLAAVTGIWGIGFLLLLAPAAVAVQAAPHATRRGRTETMALAVLFVIAAIAYGGWRLQAPATDTVRAGLASLQKPRAAALSEPDGQALAARYLAAFDRLANAGARILLIPETSFTVADASIPSFAEFATQRSLIVGTGVDFKGDAQAERNALWCSSPAPHRPRCTTSITCSSASSSTRRATATPCSKARRASAWRSARTWISTTSATPTRRAARNCCWCRLRISTWMAGCTAAWRSCAAWKAASPSRARPMPAGSP